MRSPEAVSAMLCPVCKVGLAMSDRQGIEIDYCPQCRGVWLDRGELDKIIERSTAQPAPPPPPGAAGSRLPWGGDSGGSRGGDRYPDDRYRGGHDDRRYKKKKSWLDDIFD